MDASLSPQDSAAFRRPLMAGLALDTMPLGPLGEQNALAQGENAEHQALLKAPAPASRRRRPLASLAQAEDSPSFYLSLSDLMSLLLVFFVLIFSVSRSSVEASQGQTELPRMVRGAIAQEAPAKAPAPAEVDPLLAVSPEPESLARQMTAAVAGGAGDPGLTAQPARVPREMPSPARDGFTVDRALLSLVAASGQVTPSMLPEKQNTLSQTLGQIAAEVQKTKTSGLEMESGPDKLVLRLPEAITFDLGQAELKKGMLNTLARLAMVLVAKDSCSIVVTGHTDDLPIANQQFASNWELSAARAAAVARALTDKGLNPARITIRGLADQKPRVDNDSPYNRQLNRRVEIELRAKS